MSGRSKVKSAGIFAVGLMAAAWNFGYSQEAPTLEKVYGGRVSAISAVALNRSVTRLFAATESAHSVFYADVDHSLPNPYDTAHVGFQVIPDLDANANFGHVNDIAGHPVSGKLFVSHDTGLFTCSANTGTIITNYTQSPMGKLLLKNDVLLALNGPQVFWTILTESGDLGELSGPLDTGINPPCFPVMSVHPINQRLYVMDRDNGLVLKKSSDAYHALSPSTTFSDIAIDNVITNWQGRALGIAPDGRLFVAGSQINKRVTYSDDDGATWTTVDTGIGGGAGDLCFVGNSNAYILICGSAMSARHGEDGSWTNLPHPGGNRDSNPNDGAVAADPNNPNCFYFTTDLAIGATTNSGVDIFDMCEGMTAVQINDFDMTEDKSVAWTASKSGIHRATGFPDAPVWSEAMFPDGNGAPYYSVAVDRSDTNGLTAFVGNNNIYKTTDGGTTWTNCYTPPEGVDPMFFISSIEISGPMIMAGIHYTTPGRLGGILLSTNSGAGFEYYGIDRETAGLNINDILFSDESTYVAAAYDTNAVTGAGQIYLLTRGETDRKITLSEQPVSIRDLVKDDAGGLYAAGMYANFVPAIFYKAPTAESWSELTTNGLPSDVRPQANPNWRGPVIAVGTDSRSHQVPVIAIGVKLYFLAQDAEEWTTSESLTYPNGTQINVLYWDDLMVGTDIGLFSQPTQLDPPEPENNMISVAADFDGDGLCDLAAMVEDSGAWYTWLSGQKYQLSGPFDLGIIGQPAAGDFDGDGQADLIILNNQGSLTVCYSTADYTPSAAIHLGYAGTPVIADFDGDTFPDLAIVNEENGSWTLGYSSQNYQTANGPYTLDSSGESTAGDFDNDGLADPVVNNDETGQLTVWLSGNHYVPYGPVSLGMTGRVLAGDFDGDGRDDLIDIRGDNDLHVYLRLAVNDFHATGPFPLPMPPLQ